MGVCICISATVRNAINNSPVFTGAQSFCRNLRALLATPVARPVGCWFQKSYFQVPPAGTGLSFLPAAAAVEATENAPWEPLDRPAAGAVEVPKHEGTG